MKRTALYALHQDAKARFAEYGGWTLPSSFVSPEKEAECLRSGVGLSDLSHLLKFDLKTQPQQASWRLAEQHYLVLGPPMTPPAGAIEVTSVYTALRLTGPSSRRVLSKLTSLNVSAKALPNLGCAQASLAQVPAIFLREDFGSIPSFYLLVTRDYAESVWEAIAHAGGEFHLVPVGLEALRLL